MNRYVIIVLAAVVSSAVLFGTTHFLVRHMTRQFSAEPQALQSAIWFNTSAVPIGVSAWLVLVSIVGLVAVELELRGLSVPIALATILTAGEQRPKGIEPPRLQRVSRRRASP